MVIIHNCSDKLREAKEMERVARKSDLNLLFLDITYLISREEYLIYLLRLPLKFTRS